jgi:PhnB protein
MPTTSRSSRRRFVASVVSTAAIAALPVSAETAATPQNGEVMASLTPYLLFDGNCGQAMDFYRDCFGGALTMMTVKDSPVKDHMPAIQQDKILNARLVSKLIDISASDWMMLDTGPARGNMVCLYLRGGTSSELAALFRKLSVGGNVTDPLKVTFHGVYGALNDKFGIRWMFQGDQENG